MIFSTGPTPDPKLIEERPDTVSVEAALGAWNAGYWDARALRDHHTFAEDVTELQELYDDGFGRGLRDQLHQDRINERVPREAGAGKAAGPPPARRVLSYLASPSFPRHVALAGNLVWLAVAVALLAILLAFWG